MIDSGIVIRDLYKIFGPRPKAMLAKVQQGMSKQALLEEHNHVLGLSNINIDLPARGISVIMGLSGSGKSTLIRHVNRLIEPTAGSIEIGGRNVLAMSKAELREFRRFEASMVFQKFGLHVHKTIAENVSYGLLIQGQTLEKAREHSQQWIERVGLTGFEDHYPAQLSGGMQQRVGLARALATDAPILLMDEAFSALDPLIRTDMQDILLGLQQELHKTIMFITHDLDEALKMGDDIAVLRDGSVIQQGDPQQLVLAPADAYIEDFVQDINRGRVIKLKSLSSPGEPVDGPAVSGEMVLDDALQEVVAARSREVNVSDASGSVTGTVTLEKIAAAIARPEKQNAGTQQYK